MIGAGAQVDVARFALALRAYKAATQKDMVDILNRAARNVAYRSAQFTPKGNASTIRADLMRDPHLRYALTAIALKKKGAGALKAPQFREAVERFVSRRASSANYLRAGYAKAIEELGGTFRGAHFNGADGFANKAVVSRLISEIVAITAQPNSAHAAGAEQIGLRAINEAVNFVAEDMLSYSQQKLAETARAYSG